MTLITQNEAKALLEFCDRKNVKRIKFGELEAEFFQKQAPSLDPKELAKAFSDNMPPDSAMLFASTEEIDDPSELKPETGEMPNE